MKKILTFGLLVTMMLFLFGLKTQANLEFEVLLDPEGKPIIHRGSSNPVMIPTEYNAPNEEFRGVWISPLVSDIGIYVDKTQYKNMLLDVLDVMEEYRLNSVIYHIRIMNDALYDTNLSPKSSYIRGLDFEEWDYLEWFIDEVHRRGMEFHAWLNPYRIANSVMSPETVARNYASYPENPASNPENILNGNDGTILNPGEPDVQNFVVDVCMEIIEKYDVDAIHFDDYFYINGAKDAHTYAKYNDASLNLEDWRRQQVDIVIKTLSDEIRRFNKDYNRFVQLGISPSGIYRNGNGIIHGYDDDGNAITNGSNTQGFAHYGNYLYADTKKWIDKEWIDYIVPQSYWAFGQPVAPFADVVDWWDAILEYKNVNLYAGMGIYMSRSTSTYTWSSDPLEAPKQLLYMTQHDNIQGVAMFSYQNLRHMNNVEGFEKILNEYWTNPALTPAIGTMDAVIPDTVDQVNVVKTNSGFVLDWAPINNARRYAIYRNEGTVDVNNPSQLVKVVGENKEQNRVIFNDFVDNSKNYNYAIVSVSGTNTKGEPMYLNADNLNDNVEYNIATISELDFVGTLLPNRRVQIRFYESQLYAGSELKYTLQYSYDKDTWYDIPEEEVDVFGKYSYYYYNYPNSIRPRHFRLIISNELGTVESQAITDNPHITDLVTALNVTQEIITDRFKHIIPSVE